MPRILQLYEEWEGNPPVHELVARYFGIKPKQYGDLSELLGLFPDGKIKAGGGL